MIRLIILHGVALAAIHFILTEHIIMITVIIVRIIIILTITPGIRSLPGTEIQAATVQGIITAEGDLTTQGWGLIIQAALTKIREQIIQEVLPGQQHLREAEHLQIAEQEPEGLIR